MANSPSICTVKNSTVEISKCVRDAEFLGYTYAYLLFLSNPSLQSSPISSTRYREIDRRIVPRKFRGISANLTGTIRATRFLGNFAKYRVPFYAKNPRIDKNERSETSIRR